MTDQTKGAIKTMNEKSEDIRMDAYYYGFSHTGVVIIDRILSAVACAGKAYHHTEQWTGDCEPYEDVHRGNSCAAWIQNAAVDAAAELDRLARENERLAEALLVLTNWLEDYKRAGCTDIPPSIIKRGRTALATLSPKAGTP